MGGRAGKPRICRAGFRPSLLRGERGLARQLENPWAKIADIRAAAAALPATIALTDSACLPSASVPAPATWPGPSSRSLCSRPSPAWPGLFGSHGVSIGRSSACPCARGREALAGDECRRDNSCVAADNGVGDATRVTFLHPHGAVANYVNGFAVQSRAHGNLDALSAAKRCQRWSYIRKGRSRRLSRVASYPTSTMGGFCGSSPPARSTSMTMQG